MSRPPSSGDGFLHLRLYGPLRVSIGDRVAIDERFTRRKAKALLVLLYLERTRYVPRDELLERLWPASDGLASDSGRLKQTVLVLRRALEAGRSRRTGWRHVIEHDGSYLFNGEAPYESDLERFEQHLHLAQRHRQRGELVLALYELLQALEIRRADLLSEFRYDDWAAPFIAAEREAYLRALDEAAELQAARGDVGSAIALLRRAAREDPLRETSILQLMELLVRTGEATEAVRLYAQLRRALAERFQMEPDPRLTTLFQRIKRARSPARP